MQLIEIRKEITKMKKWVSTGGRPGRGMPEFYYLTLRLSKALETVD